MSFIKREADYAIRISAFLANKKGLVKIDYICEKLYLNKPVVIKIIHRLSKCGLITSETGRHGGVALSSDAENLSLLDILKCMGYVNTINVCVDQPEKCLLNPICNITAFFKDLQYDVERKLQSAKLKDFVFTEDRLTNLEEV